jgi:dephospho-CoA kinase
MASNNKPVVFSTLENAQNVTKIAKIFSASKPTYQLKPKPYLIVLVGTPGVGKTTKAKEILKNQLGVNYEDFYNISLDSLVERVKPYRIVTKKLYNTLKAKRKELGSNELTNKNYALLSEVYLPTIMSKKSNFTLGETELAKLNKISKLNQNEKKSTQKKSGEPNTNTLDSLRDMRLKGLEYGVNNGFNILYDTTLRELKNIIKDDIMTIVEKNKDIKYKIVVILVTAPASNVRQRIKGRHTAMLLEEYPYIRAVSPLAIEVLIKDNKKGFDIAKSYFKTYNSKQYSKNDFTFIEIENPSKNNYKNTNNFKYW